MQSHPPQNPLPIMPAQQQVPPMYPRNNPLPGDDTPQDGPGSPLHNARLITYILGSILMVLVIIHILLADYLVFVVAHAFSKAGQ